MHLPYAGRPTRRTIYLGILLLLTSAVSLVGLIIPFLSSVAENPLQVGSVATQDIQAPHALTYESPILTGQLREQRAAEVTAVFSPADTNLARRQLERLRAALSFISAVRADNYATQEQKYADLSFLEYINLSNDTAQNILGLSNSRWQAVQQEAILVLEQVMRTTIREDKIGEVRQNIPSLVSLSFPEDQAAIITELVSSFVIPNSLYDQTATKAARQQARDSVTPVVRTFIAGETIIQRGSVLTELDLETLAQFDLSTPGSQWQELVGAIVLVLVVMAFMTLYAYRKPYLTKDTSALRSLSIIALLFVTFLISARLIIPGHTVLPYLFPLAGYSMVVSTLFEPELALISTLPLAIMVTYGLPSALELTLFYVLSSFFSVLILGRAKRITAFFWASAAVALCGTAVVIVYHLPQPSTDWVGIATLAVGSVVNGVGSASITLLMQFFLAQLLGKTTALQLMELSRPDHPLLQLLLRSAPGTYQHSLQVSNLAEQAAERIGADALLTRIGALYHDAGKAINSIFFIENQVPGELNPHDDLDPIVGAAIIIRHVKDGLELARKYRLPRRIQDFISEHHGNMITRYQYGKALEAVNNEESRIDIEHFRYPGPRPQSRETAIVMLADGCEARVRAERPKDENELRLLIKKVIEQRMSSGALDEASLTLRDMDVIADSFTATLRGIYHPRIQYPSFEQITPGQTEKPDELPASVQPEATQTNPSTNTIP